MSLHEIVLPETKPETEWVRGRALQKVSPTYSHAILQRLLIVALGAWADDGDYGRVGPEWRFRVAPPREVVRPLVPDAAFLSYDALPREAPFDNIEVPLAAPTVAVEILSPRDRRADVADKVATYLAAGSAAVIVVDPKKETVVINDRAGWHVLVTGDTLAHASMPGFALDVGALFERMKK